MVRLRMKYEGPLGFRWADLLWGSNVCTMCRCNVHQQLVLLVRRLAEVKYPWSLRAVHSACKLPLHDLQQLDAATDTKLLLSHKQNAFSTWKLKLMKSDAFLKSIALLRRLLVHCSGAFDASMATDAIVRITNLFLTQKHILLKCYLLVLS